MPKPHRWVPLALGALTLVSVADSVALFHFGEVRHGVMLTFASAFWLGFTYLATLPITDRAKAVKGMLIGFYFFLVFGSLALSRLAVGWRLLAFLFWLGAAAMMAREAVRLSRLPSRGSHNCARGS
jgi:hypothetical protein